MKSVLLSALVLPLALATVVPRSQKVDYNGYKLLRVTLPEGVADAEDQLNELAIHVLKPGKSSYMQLVVSPDNIDAVNALAAETTVVDNDVGKTLEEEGELAPFAVPNDTYFTAYHSYDDHLKFLRDLQAGFPGNSEIVNVGRSVQGRTLTGIHIWGSGGKGSKKAIVFHGTVHAREWAATMTTEYMAYQLLTKYATDPRVKAVVDKYDFYITPIVNPDGFVYSQTTDRLWRKNRQTISGNSCVGRDINRNWPFKWEVPGGASTNPCSETFKGRAAVDAPETAGLKAQIDALKASKGVTLYIDFHTYGQYILWPYGYDCAAAPPNEADQQSLAAGARTSIASLFGTSYTIGPACDTLYATTGDSTDYTQGSGAATYSYTYELRDTGRYGFSLPASQISATVRETWLGVLSMLENAK